MQDDATKPERPGFIGWSVVRFGLIVGPLAVYGGFLLRFAALDSGPLRALAGATLSTIAAWMTSEYVDARWHGRRFDDVPVTEHVMRWRLAIAACAVSGVVALVLAEWFHVPEFGFGGLMFLAVGAGPLVAALRGRGDDVLERPAPWIGFGLAVSATGLLALETSGSIAGPGALILLGLVGYGRGIEHHGRQSHLARPPGPLLRSFPGSGRSEPVLVAAVGGALLVAGITTEIAGLRSIGIWLVVISMMAVGAARGRLRLGATAELGALVLGPLLIATAGWFTWTTGIAGDSRTFLAFIVLGVAAAGATLIVRLEIVFAVVVLGFMFVWSLAPFTTEDRNDVSAATAPPTAVPSIIAFGDSYISGEGATEFYDGTDQKGADRNECRRAPTAYPVLLANGSGDDGLAVPGIGDGGLTFLACSGATAVQVVEIDTGLDAEAIADREAERRSTLPCDDVPDERLFAQYPCGPDGVYGDDLQIRHLPASASGAGLVLVSIGGNDARFGEVVTGCLLPGSCAERREVWLDRVGTLGVDLQLVYEQILAAVGPDVPVVVMPYPLVMTEQTCAASPLEQSEHEFVTEFTLVLNEQIEAATRRAGVHFFDDGVFSFLDHRICESPDPAINLIALQPTDGPFRDRMNPGSWTHNSMHPNALGHRLIAERLAAWLRDEGIVERARANPLPMADATSQIRDLRAARPFAVDPTTAEDLRAAFDAGPCDAAMRSGIDGFATRVEVADESSLDPTDPAVRVALPDADPTAAFCVTDRTGAWHAVTAEPSAGSAGQTITNDDVPSVSIGAGGVPILRGGRPGDECPAVAGSVRCDLQWVLFSPTPGVDGDGEPTTRQWQLRAISHCSNDPGCPNTIGAWTSNQLAAARREVLPPLGVVFVGGWLTALGVGVNRHRLRRWWTTWRGSLAVGRSS